METETKLAAAIADIEIPRRLQKLPISEKGFPIPAFVAWLATDSDRYLPEGTFGARRDFRIVDPLYMDRCFRIGRCWLCGEPMGQFRIFAIGPMCLVNRTTMEPPSHRACVEYAVKACPFLVNPRARRNPKDMPDEHQAPGMLIERNPGVTALYQTNDYRRFRAGGGMLCRLGAPERIEWYCEGRRATKKEVVDSIESGMPILMKEAQIDGPDSVADLRKMRTEARRWLPD